MDLLTLDNTAEELGVSSATVRNWIRQGIIIPSTKSSVSVQEVNLIRAKIQNGEIKRLRKRANKTRSEISFIPDEYVSDAQFVSEIENTVRFVLDAGLNVSESLLVIALKHLVLLNEVFLENTFDIFSLSSYSNWKRPGIKKEIQAWFDSIRPALTTARHRTLFDLVRQKPLEDYLGVFFQSIQREGDKSLSGSYYTPAPLIDDGFKELGPVQGRFLDPCCGTGRILLRAIHAGVDSPQQIVGIEKDEIPWRIARLNLMLAFPAEDFSPSIYHGDALCEIANGTKFCDTNELLNSFAVIATNPPWGACQNKFNAARLPELFPQIQSGESFSLFASKCLDFANNGGRVMLFLPDSFLNIKFHNDIRKMLLDVTDIISIARLGRCFKGVFTHVIRLIVEKRAPQKSEIQVIKETGERHLVDRRRFESNPDFAFDICANNQEIELIDFLYQQKHTTLKGHADWALGIVTGNNEKYLLDQPVEGSEPIFRGSDIEPYRIGLPRRFIRFQPGLFQQTAPEIKYRAKEKLIYKFISNRLEFAYDPNGSLTLNSANILIPSLPGISAKALLGVLNSSIILFVYKKRFNTHKVLRGNLEALPIPVFSTESVSRIERLVNRAISGQPVQNEIDLFIANSFNLTFDQFTRIQTSAVKVARLMPRGVHSDRK